MPKILHFHKKVPKKSGLFLFLEEFWSEKSDWVFGLPSPPGLKKGMLLRRIDIQSSVFPWISAML